MPFKFRPLLTLRSTKRPFGIRVLLVTGAVLCFGLGIVGWLLPVITGIPFYVLGLILLGMASERVRAWINRTEAKLSPRWRKLLRTSLARIPIRKIRDWARG